MLKTLKNGEKCENHLVFYDIKIENIAVDDVLTRKMGKGHKMEKKLKDEKC